MSASTKKILVVDDDPEVAASVADLFDPQEFSCQTAGQASSAFQKLSNENFDLLLLDVNLPDRSGLDILQEIKAKHHDLPVVVITGFVSAEGALQAMKDGAYEFLTKPFTAQKLSEVVKRALGQPQKKGKAAGTDWESAQEFTEDALIGKSPEIVEIAKLIGQVAQSDAAVLITGESGTGKELVAQAIHKNSKRCDKAFLSVNCAALPETLLESEMFGHEKGAFTGAYSRKPGKFEQCHTGTIFLDEVADMSLLTQSKVLRVLQEQAFERVGGDQTIKVDVRIIAATNKSLVQCMRENQFRVDLFYRLKVVSLYLPPLRERKVDIPLLAGHFLRRYARELNKPVQGFAPDVQAALASYHWPGNVRELENNIHTAVVLAKEDILTLEHFPFYSENKNQPQPTFDELRDDYSKVFTNFIDARIGHLVAGANNRLYHQLEDALEKSLITAALRHFNSNQSKTAEVLGLSRNTLRDRMQRFGLFGQAIQE